MLGLFNLFGPGADAIDPRDAVTMFEKDEAVLVDVRDPNELAGGYAKGAVNIPLSQLQQKADPGNPACHDALKAGKPVILYCASGARSGMAGRTLRKLGYEAVFNVGSLGTWQAAGGRTTR